MSFLNSFCWRPFRKRQSQKAGFMPDPLPPEKTT
jgi:hypothetical protein